MDALTEPVWIKTLQRIVNANTDDTTRTLAQMLLDIINVSTDPQVDAILDTWGAQLLGPLR